MLTHATVSCRKAAVALLLLIASLISSIMVGRNFNKGLKEHSESRISLFVPPKSIPSDTVGDTVLAMSRATTLLPTRAISTRLHRSKASSSTSPLARSTPPCGTEKSTPSPYFGDGPIFQGYGLEQYSYSVDSLEKYDLIREEGGAMALPELKRGQTMKRYHEAFALDGPTPLTTASVGNGGRKEFRISMD